MTDLLQIQKNDIRILVYTVPKRNDANTATYSATKINIVVGVEDITFDFSQFRQLIDVLDAVRDLI